MKLKKLENLKINKLFQKIKKTNISYYFIYISLLLFIFLLFFVVVKLNNNKPYLKHRSYTSIKKYINDKDFIEGLGGAYIPDSIPTPLACLNYTIGTGDSIHSISSKFGIDEVTIINYNDIKIPSKIVRGLNIKIPNQDGIIVKVDKKNSLDALSEKYKVEKDEIVRINNISEESECINTTVFVPGIHFDSVTKSLLLGEYFRAPVYGRFTSYFGYRKDPWTKQRSFHQGVDIANMLGTRIYSAAPGKVIFTGEYWPLGNAIKIQHTDGYVTYYGHLSKIYVKNNTWVTGRQLIGAMGSTGRSTGSHLHYEVRKNGVAINPFRMTVF